MLLTVAVIGGAQGLRGHVRLLVRTDDPTSRFRPGVVLVCDHPSHSALTVAEARHAGASWQVRFAEVHDRSAAEELRGAILSIETDEWESGADEWYDHEIVGLPARTPAGGPLGDVVAVEHGSAQDLLVVRTPEGREARVPFVGALVPRVATDGVTIDPPAGLFEGGED